MNKLDPGSVNLVSTIAEMILQLRVDVRRDTYAWFNTLFKDFNASSQPQRTDARTFSEIVKKPLHLIDVRIQQEERCFSRITLALNFCLLEKRTGRELCHEHWTLDFQTGHRSEPIHNASMEILGAMAHIHNKLMTLPIWLRFLNSESSHHSRRLTHFVDYRITVAPLLPAFKI